jgi:hypothetical protein
MRSVQPMMEPEKEMKYLECYRYCKAHPKPEGSITLPIPHLKTKMAIKVKIFV